jgi:hypothetical protein
VKEREEIYGMYRRESVRKGMGQLDDERKGVT